MINYLDKQDLMEEMTDEVTLVDFFANWCGPCKMLGEELEEMKDVKIIKIDTDTHEDLAREHGVMSIPYVEIYKNKELVTKFIGFKTKDEIEEILRTCKILFTYYIIKLHLISAQYCYCGLFTY